jgi:hypothetical protein
MYGWGVKITDQSAARDPDFDVLVVEAPISTSITTEESFTMKIFDTESDIIMAMSWDNVVVPLTLEIKD